MFFFLTFSIIINMFCANVSLADIACDEWKAYKSEKCIKIFQTLQTYEEAENTCTESNATLVTISSLEEQHFIVDYLITAEKTVDNVWIGLNYIYNKYKWVKDLDVTYSNWAQSSPKNNPTYCVQLLSNENKNITGKWSDVSCTRKNFALCEKPPTITSLQLLELLLNTRKQLYSSIDNNSIKFENANKEIKSLKVELIETNKVLEDTVLQLYNSSFELESTKSELIVTNRKLDSTSDLLSNTSIDNTSKQLNNTLELLLTNRKLENTAELSRNNTDQLAKTNKQIDYFFSRKWNQFKTFADENNNRKALIYPFKTQNSVSRSEAIEICNQNNATLVDIESEEKQKLVESFLYQINRNSEIRDFWLSGYADSIGTYKWMNSGNEFQYTNWAAGEPDSNTSRYTCIFFNNDRMDSGKWFSYSVNNTMNVFCEISFNF